MNWESLPVEIRLLIIEKRNKIRQTAAKVIQKQWNKFQAPKQTAIYLWERLKAENPDDWEPEYPCMIFPETAHIMKFTSKVLSGKEDHKYWSRLFGIISYGMYLDEYTGGPGAIFHQKIQNDLKILENKFNMIWNPNFNYIYIHDAI